MSSNKKHLVTTEVWDEHNKIMTCVCVCVYLSGQNRRWNSSPEGLLSHRADLDFGKVSGATEFPELLDGKQK